jgi:hypothetical protein
MSHIRAQRKSPSPAEVLGNHGMQVKSHKRKDSLQRQVSSVIYFAEVMVQSLTEQQYLSIYDFLKDLKLEQQASCANSTKKNGGWEKWSNINNIYWVSNQIR